MLHALAAEHCRAGDLVAARRAQRPRPLLRRRGARRCSPRSRTSARTSSTAAPTRRPRGPRLRRAGRLDRVAPRGARPAARRRGLPLRAGGFMDELSAGLAAIGLAAARIHTEPFGPAPGLTPGIAAAPARPPHPPAGEPGTRPARRVRPQRPRRPLEQRLRQPAGACRGLRRAGPLVLPHRRLPQLRDDVIAGSRRLQPRPGRAPGRRQRAHLLLAATRRRGPRPLNASATARPRPAPRQADALTANTCARARSQAARSSR